MILKMIRKRRSSNTSSHRTLVKRKRKTPDKTFRHCRAARDGASPWRPLYSRNHLKVTVKESRLVALHFAMLNGSVVEVRVELDRLVGGGAVLVLQVAALYMAAVAAQRGSPPAIYTVGRAIHKTPLTVRETPPGSDGKTARPPPSETPPSR